MNRLRTSFTVCLAALPLLFAGCTTPSTTSSSPAPEADVLRVGIAPQFPPLAFKSGGEFKGVEPDMARALAADLGKSIEFVEVPWEGLTDALLTRKIDIIMSGMTITQARLMRVNFTTPYLQAGQTLLVRRTDAALIQVSLFDPETTVGAQKATTGDFWAKQNCARNKRKLYPSPSLGAKALVSGQIDAFICDAPVNWWLASENEAAGLTVAGGYLTEEYLGWAVRKGDTQLLEAANRFIEQGREDGSLRALIRNWIPYL
jgi:polar amino acid transport system substrate-binding protein